MNATEGMQYNIEHIAVNKENGKMMVCISGWFFGTDRTIQLYNADKNAYEGVVEYYYREDVNQYLEVNDSSNNGFVIKAVWNKDDNWSLDLSAGEQKAEYEIDGLRGMVKEYRASHGLRKYVNRRNLKKVWNYIRVFGIRKAIKRIFEKLKENQQIQEKVTPYIYDYKFEEESIPQEWLNIQKIQSKFAILIEIEKWHEEYELGWRSLLEQSYKNFKVFIKVSQKERSNVENAIGTNALNGSIEFLDLYNEKTFTDMDYLVKFDLFDQMSVNTLAHFVECINDKLQPEIVYCDYDFFEKDNVYHTRIKKEGIPNNKITNNVVCRGVCAVKNTGSVIEDFEEYVKGLLSDTKKETGRVVYISRVLIHRRIRKDNSDPTKAIAFYLPQFHAIPENDEWWGKGFTEWTNVKRGIPMFDGHNQPRVPGELGYYNLVEDKDVQAKQAELAKEHNVYGFCYYHYWFNGKRLLEKPVEYILAHKEITQPFCICWANENWTKTWDGLHKDILIEQVHEQDSDERFIKDILNIISDERYIRINNKPLLLVYKIALLHDGKKAIEKWREEVKKYGIEDLYVAIVKQPGVESAEQFGADAVVEFPPHDMNVNNITDAVTGLNKDFTGGVYDYSELANRDLAIYDYTMFRACMLQWDNTARRMERASIFHNFHEEDYKRWLLRCKEYELLFNEPEEQLVFINAWNEWAEGTCLEPDEKYGDSFLKITKQILESR